MLPPSSRRARAVVVALALAAAVGVGSRAARADDRDEARALGRAGLALYDRGDYAGALENFRRGYAMFAAPTIGLYEARSLERLGRLVEARDVYARVAATPIDRSADAAFRKAVADARRELDDVKPRIPTLTVSVSPKTARAVVTLDGASVEPGARREVDPGAHRVEASEDGRTARATITLAERAEKALTLEIPPPAAPPPPVVIVAPAPNRAGSTQRTLGWIGLGAGAAGLAAGGAMGIAALAVRGSFADACKDGTCSADKRSDVSTYSGLRTGATIGLWAGGGLAGTGLVLLLTAPRRAAPEVALRGGPGSIRLEGSF